MFVKQGHLTFQYLLEENISHNNLNHSEIMSDQEMNPNRSFKSDLRHSCISYNYVVHDLSVITENFWNISLQSDNLKHKNQHNKLHFKQLYNF